MGIAFFIAQRALLLLSQAHHQNLLPRQVRRNYRFESKDGSFARGQGLRLFFSDKSRSRFGTNARKTRGA